MHGHNSREKTWHPRFWPAFFASAAFVLWCIYCTILSFEVLSSVSDSIICSREYIPSEYAPAITEPLQTEFLIPDFSSLTSKPLAYQRFTPNNSLLDECWDCPMGVGSPRANSSERDLILLFATSHRNPHFFRALRSANCQATIVVLTTSDRVQSVPTACNVRVIDIGVFIGKSPPDPMAVLSHCLMARFLHLYRNDFDRVLICDPESSIIQADPFTSYFTLQTIGLPLFDGEPSRELLKELELIDAYFDKAFYLEKEMLSDRLIYGGVPVVLRLYEIVMRHERIRSGEATESFGAYLNYCNANNIFRRLTFFPSVAKPGDDFVLANSQTMVVSKWDVIGRRVFHIEGEPRAPLVLATGIKKAFLLESACIKQPAPTRMPWKEIKVNRSKRRLR
jgi:hypothetical protein